MTPWEFLTLTVTLILFHTKKAEFSITNFKGVSGGLVGDRSVSFLGAKIKLNIKAIYLRILETKQLAGLRIIPISNGAA